jgi:hypothetical protein
VAISIDGDEQPLMVDMLELIWISLRMRSSGVIMIGRGSCRDTSSKEMSHCYLA